MAVTFRKRSLGEWMLLDAASIAINTPLCAVAIMLFDYLGWLSYLGVGSPTWGQALAVGFLISGRPVTRASRYEPST